MGTQNPNPQLDTSTAVEDMINTPPPVRAGDPSERGGVNSIVKGEQSCVRELLADGFGEAAVSASVMRGATEMRTIVANIIISLLLLAILLAVAAEALRVDGIAAPILGR